MRRSTRLILDTIGLLVVTNIATAYMPASPYKQALGELIGLRWAQEQLETEVLSERARIAGIDPACVSPNEIDVARRAYADVEALRDSLDAFLDTARPVHDPLGVLERSAQYWERYDSAYTAGRAAAMELEATAQMRKNDGAC